MGIDQKKSFFQYQRQTNVSQDAVSLFHDPILGDCNVKLSDLLKYVGVAGAYSQEEEDAAFAAGFMWVMRWDLAGLSEPSTTTTSTSTTGAPNTPTAPSGSAIFTNFSDSPTSSSTSSSTSSTSSTTVTAAPIAPPSGTAVFSNFSATAPSGTATFTNFT